MDKLKEMHTITQRENTDSNKKPLMYKRSSIILTTNFSSEIMEAKTFREHI